MGLILIFLSFSACSVAGLLTEDLRKKIISRHRKEWAVDIGGLFIQGIIVPAFPFLVIPILNYFFSSKAGSIDLNPFIQFIISFIIIDYLYYWNHRYFHSKLFWYLHRLHHSSRHLDVFATSRNGVITSFLFVYVWAQIAGLYFLKDSSAFLAGLTLTFALDLWRHSGLELSNSFTRVLAHALILPEHHTLHHSYNCRNKNYGANFNWWDKLHGTFSDSRISNSDLEKTMTQNFLRELFLPTRSGR